MNAWQNLARRVRAPKHGRGEEAMPANVVLADSPVPLPAPTFTPADPIRETRPIHVPSGRHAAPGRQEPRRPAVSVTDLRRVSAGLLAHSGAAPDAAVPDRQQFEAEVQAAFRSAMRPSRAGAAPEPETAAARAARFTADMRKARSGGLPVFRATGLARGWCGLDTLAPAETVPAPPRWSTDRWAQQAMAAIAAQTGKAQAEISRDFDAVAERCARVWEAADAALALGYPGEAL